MIGSLCFLQLIKLEKAKFIPLHTILCGLANLAGNEKPYKMELDTAKKEKANAAKVFYQLSRDGVPILDLELRYKGDFKSMPQFFTTKLIFLPKPGQELFLARFRGPTNPYQKCQNY